MFFFLNYLLLITSIFQKVDKKCEEQILKHKVWFMFLLQAPEESDASQKPPEPAPVEETPPQPEKSE